MPRGLHEQIIVDQEGLILTRILPALASDFQVFFETIDRTDDCGSADGAAETESRFTVQPQCVSGRASLSPRRPQADTADRLDSMGDAQSTCA